MGFWDSMRAREKEGLDKEKEVGLMGLGLWVMRKETKK